MKKVTVTIELTENGHIITWKNKKFVAQYANEIDRIFQLLLNGTPNKLPKTPEDKAFDSSLISELSSFNEAINHLPA